MTGSRLCALTRKAQQRETQRLRFVPVRDRGPFVDAYPHSNFCRGSDSLSVGSEEVDQGPWCTRLLRLDLSTRRVPGTVTGGPTVEVTAMACLPPPNRGAHWEAGGGQFSVTRRGPGQRRTAQQQRDLPVSRGCAEVSLGGCQGKTWGHVGSRVRPPRNYLAKKTWQASLTVGTAQAVAWKEL